jgi:hypothetical protein
MVVVSGFAPGFGVFEIELLSVSAGTSDRSLGQRFGIEVEDTPRVQPHEDLDAASFQALLQSHRIIARIEDEHGCIVAVWQPVQMCSHLLRGHAVGIFFWLDPTSIYRCHPRVTLEAHTRHELVAPSGDDGLPGGVAARVVMVTARRAALRVAPRPRGNAHRVDEGSFTPGRQLNTAQ